MRIQSVKISIQDFKEMLDTESSVEVSDILVRYLKDYVLVQGMDSHRSKTYFLDDLNVWKIQSDVSLASQICRLISTASRSYIKHLNNECKEFIKSQNKIIRELELSPDDNEEKIEEIRNSIKSQKKGVKMLSKKASSYKFIKTRNIKTELYYDILDNLLQNEISFNDDPNGIHFLNGRFNLETGKLEERKASHYISKLSNNAYNYKPSTQEDQDYIITEIGKLFRNEEDRDYTLQLLGSVLSGLFVSSQMWIFFYGLGSTAKSFLLDFFTYSVGDAYYHMFQKEMLLDSNKSSSMRSKELNSINPNIRIYHVNELEPNKCDKNLLKQFADGRISNTALYKDGSHTLIIKGIMFITSNDMISFRADSGINRRLYGIEFKNLFLEPHEKGFNKIDNKTSFVKDRNFLNKLTEGQRTAYFDILAKYCKMWYEGKALKPSSGYQEAKSEIVEANDVWGEFIDDVFIKEEGYCVSVEEVLQDYHDMNPHKKKSINRGIIIKEFKKQGIVYDRQKKLKKAVKRGVFFGLRYKTDNDSIKQDDLGETGEFAFEDDTEVEQPEDNKQVKLLKKENEYLRKELLEAEDRIKQLEDQIKDNTISNMLFEEDTKTKNIEDDFNDSEDEEEEVKHKYKTVKKETFSKLNLCFE